MPLTKLTENEKLVFYNLVKYPDLNDEGLAKKTGVKRSTITSIRNRLKKEGFYNTHIVPNLSLFGCKVICVLYGKFNPKTPMEMRRSAATFEDKLNQPELVYGKASDSECVFIYFGEDLYNIRRMQDKFLLDYGAHGFFEEVYRVYFPMEMCFVKPYFNYSRVLGKVLGIEDNGKIDSIGGPHLKTYNFSNTEKMVLSAIVKHPDKTNNEIAELTNKTRSTVGSIRKKLLKDGAIRVENIPVLDKLGCELMVFYHSKMNPKAPIIKREDGIELALEEFRSIFSIMGDMESVGIFIPRNYTEYAEIFNKVVNFYKSKEYLLENPYIVLFPIHKLKLNKLDFAPLVEKLLFGEKEKSRD